MNVFKDEGKALWSVWVELNGKWLSKKEQLHYTSPGKKEPERAPLSFRNIQMGNVGNKSAQE